MKYQTTLYEAYVAPYHSDKAMRRYYTSESDVYKYHGPSTSWRLVCFESDAPLNFLDGVGTNWNDLTVGGAIEVKEVKL